MGVTLRDANVRDAEGLARLVGQLGYPCSADAVRKRLERLSRSESDRVVVADREGLLIGLAGVHVSFSIAHDEPAAKLSALVVDESERHHGVGAALIGEIERAARLRGCRLLFLTTAERRHAAHAFYRRLGFEETGRRFAKPLR